MTEYYRLTEDGAVVPCSPKEGMRQWGADRRIGLYEAPGVRVSTVFMPLNHQFGDGPPLVFETMVFGGPLDGEMERYSTKQDAEVGHAAMVRRVQGGGA